MAISRSRLIAMIGVPVLQIKTEVQAERSGISIHRKVKKSAEHLFVPER
jgi:hypothetical protein